MVSAAIDGKKGNPGEFRNYHLKTIMSEKVNTISEKTHEKFVLCQ